MNRVMSAAVGDVPFDLVLCNARIVNVYTGEVYSGEIGIVGDRIAYVSEPDETGLAAATRYDCGGRFVLPGLIDTHVHMESGMMTPANFARTVIPHGTTTILADPHEFCNVLGLDGMAYCTEASRDILLRVLLAAPSCVPSMPGESNKMAFGPDEVGRLLDVPAAAALGEVMDYVGVVRQDDRMMSILAEARKRGKIIQGHIINPTARELAAYMAAGVESDHESRLTDEALRKLRAGMVVECRNGSSARNIAALAPALKAAGYPVNATLATDDREPDDLLHDGHIDEAIRQAVRAGVPPVYAIQMATRNAALFLGRKDLGGLKPGAVADIVVADSLDDFRVGAVFVRGVLAAERGDLVVDIPAGTSPIEQRNTMNLARLPVRDDFLVRATGDAVVLNAMSFLNGDPFHTTLAPTRVPVRDGVADIGSVDGLVTMAVLERHNATGNIGVAPAANIGLTRGAVAGTVAHDSHNLFVFGKNVDDMVVAATCLARSGGGFAAVENGQILAKIRLPVAGLVSTKPVRELAAEVDAMKTVLRGLGIDNHAPVNFLTWFCLAVLPEVRLTDKGLVETTTQKMIPLFAS